MAENAPLYQRVMGDAWMQIAAPVRAVHTTRSAVRARGHLRVEHGRHPLARLLARMLRLPRPDPAAAIQLLVTPCADGERWERTFNGRRLVTQQHKLNDFELAERFGVLEFRFRLDACGGSLLYVQREASVRVGRFRLRIPAQLAPRVGAREDPAGPTRIKIDVRVTLPGIGPFITYDGIVDVEDTRA